MSSHSKLILKTQNSRSWLSVIFLLFHAHFGNEIKSIYQTDTHSFPKENNIAIDIHLPNPKNVTDKCDQLESQKTLNSPFQLSLYLQSITSTIILKFEAIRDGRGENVQELT
uniref:Uncharacterized protein n=1 Tax=Solanum lycopersicum TaxID=4081 RepID=A0A3Q7HHK0_SOLLC